GSVTPDLGGQATTSRVTAFVKEIVAELAIGRRHLYETTSHGSSGGRAGWYASAHHELECAMGDGLLLEPPPAGGAPRPAGRGRRLYWEQFTDSIRRQAWL
ncbi:MAG: hypothetical protein ACUVT1_03490, partial [Anaerolineae bacterium]